MATIKISSRVEAAVWEELKQLAHESDRSISRILTDAIGDHRVRPEVLRQLRDSVAENEELGRLLAK